MLPHAPVTAAAITKRSCIPLRSCSCPAVPCCQPPCASACSSGQPVRQQQDTATCHTGSFCGTQVAHHASLCSITSNSEPEDDQPRLLMQGHNSRRDCQLIAHKGAALNNPSWQAEPYECAVHAPSAPTHTTPVQPPTSPAVAAWCAEQPWLLPAASRVQTWPGCCCGCAPSGLPPSPADCLSRCTYKDADKAQRHKSGHHCSNLCHKVPVR